MVRCEEIIGKKRRFLLDTPKDEIRSQGQPEPFSGLAWFRPCFLGSRGDRFACDSWTYERSRMVWAAVFFTFGVGAALFHQRLKALLGAKNLLIFQGRLPKYS